MKMRAAAAVLEATDSAQDGQIGSGSRIGIVSFATEATQDTQLIASVSELNAAVDALEADGFTNHADAFEKALALFDPASDNVKVIMSESPREDKNEDAFTFLLNSCVIICFNTSSSYTSWAKK